MISMVITALLCCALVASIFQPNAPRLFAAGIFLALTASHELFLSSLDGFRYYGSAALLDLLIIILTSGVRPLPAMVLTLHRICAASILVNGVGWVIWALYYPPVLYDLSFVALYAWLIFTLTRKDPENVGVDTMDRGRSCFRFDRSTCGDLLNKHGGKI
jgi:hypothetical protein